MWHNPGTVIRATDGDSAYRDAFTRICRDELELDTMLEPHFVTGFLHKTRRGTESSRVYWLELPDTPKTGRFFDIASLPEDTIASHVDIIMLAAAAFRQVTD